MMLRYWLGTFFLCFYSACTQGDADSGGPARQGSTAATSGKHAQRTASDGGELEPDAASSEHEEDQDAGAVRVVYDEIVRSAIADGPTPSLCALVHSERTAGGGIYEVESLTGVRERDLYDEADDSLRGFTYVGLKLIEPWFDAEERPIARISGGPGGQGTTQGWFISLRVGQKVGLLFMTATPENNDHLGLDATGVFAERAADSFSNGSLFTEEAVDARELTALVKEVVADEECSVDTLPSERHGSGQ